MKTLSHIALFICVATALAAAEPYFPKDSISDFEQEWYAKHLSTMREPVLTANAKDKSYVAFRILYLPTWGRPVALRYEKTGERIVRRAVMLSGDGGYDPGKIKKQDERDVKQSEIDDVFAGLERSGFWRLSPKDDVRGLDGSEFIVEVIRDGKYHAFFRWTPTHDTEKRGLAGILELSRRLFRQGKFGDQIAY